MKYTIYCIIQPGELEIQSLLLLSSLRKNLVGDYRILACIPDQKDIDTRFQAATFPQLDNIGASVLRFKNPLLEKGPELLEGDIYSNKYYPLPHLPESDYTVFLDSDLLLINKIDLSTEIFGADFMAKPVCYMNESRWKELYDLFGMEIPANRVRATVDQQEGPPYFNGGMIAIKSNLTSDLFNIWEDTFGKISRSNIMQDNLANREQVALAISIVRLNCSYRLVSESMNFPARSKQISEDTPPVLIHYHDPESIYKNQMALRVVRKLFLTYPALLKMASEFKNWRILTEKPGAASQTLKRLKYKFKGYYQAKMVR
jgi:hypothetical protein